MINHFNAIASRLSANRTIRAINYGLTSLIPLILIGAFILAILNLPIPLFQESLKSLFGENWRNVGLVIHNATLNIMSLAALITVSFSLANEFGSVKNKTLSPISIVLTTFSCYVIILKQDTNVITFPFAGSNGLFFALFISILVPRIFFGFNYLRNRFLSKKTSVFNVNLQTRSSFKAILPAFCTILLFALIRLLLDYTHWDQAASQLFTNLLVNHVVNNSFFSVVIVVFLTQILWFFGIHGGNVIMDNIPVMATPEASIGATGFVITKQFYDIFIYLGGSGATLGLLLAMFFDGGKYKEKKLAKVSLFPAIFNINETLVYGTPLIFNPYYLIPFVFAPIVLGSIAYGVFALGLIPFIANEIQWTTPIFLSGYLSTGSVAGALLQLLFLLLSFFIYLPFVRLSKNNEYLIQLQTFAELKEEIPEIMTNQYTGLLNRNNKVGELARELAHEMEECFRIGQVPFHLEYQPKVNPDGKTLGAEALLRWKHPIYGNISPVILLAIADEALLTNQVGYWVYNEALDEFSRWKQKGLEHLRISINLTPLQLRHDKHLIDMIKKGIERTGADPCQIDFELTEHTAMHSTEATQEKLEAIRALGINLSIDDLGMGYSSLTYLSDFTVNTLKIDRSLINSISTDISRQEIIRSILILANQLSLYVIVEGVETQEQLDTLTALGCHYFQGYYFSKPLCSEEFVQYVLKNGILENYEIFKNEFN